jgi:osmotically-inducible protein OsmY
MIVDQVTAGSHERISRDPSRLRFEEAPRAGREVSSASLQNQVLAALAHSGYAALSSIGCEVNGERVILFGKAPSYHLKQLAQVFAQRVDGVGKVVNRIAVFA